MASSSNFILGLIRRVKTSSPGSQDWCEPIVVLGKGVPAYSTTYGCLICCIAGISRGSEWIRLYPVFLEPVLSTIEPINNFDIIRTVFRQKHPEPDRPESRKIFPEFVKKVGEVGDKEARVKILKEHTEPGSFLHDDSWRGRKTLGMVKPIEKHFWLTEENKPMVRFSCSNSCGGHTCQVGEYMKFNDFGRIQYQESDPKLAQQLETLQDSELRFVMGTIRRYPSRWLLISIHLIE